MIRPNVLPGLVSAAALLAPRVGGADSRTSVSVKITEQGVTAQVTPHGLMLLVR